jgi:PhoH-like ATPase
LAAVSGSEPTILVADTNMLYAEPDMLELLTDPRQHLVIARTVIKELDRHKEEASDRAHMARGISARLFRLIEDSHETTGIRLPAGGYLSFGEVNDRFELPSGFDRTKPDDRIVGLALELKRANPQTTVKVLTRDNNAALLAKTVGLRAERFKVEVDRKSLEEVQAGPIVIKAGVSELDALVELSNGKVTRSALEDLGLPKDIQLHQNQFVLFEATNSESTSDATPLKDLIPRVWRYKKLGSGEEFFYPLKRSAIEALVIQPRNLEQLMAVDLLLDPNVHLVTLSGRAGTGKTLLTLAAGLAQSPLFDPSSPFDRIIVTRPHQVTGQELGHLPGTLDEKMEPYMGPFTDNLEVIIETMRENGPTKKTIRLNPFPVDAGLLGAGKHQKLGLGKGLSLEDFRSERVSIKELIQRIRRSDFFKVEAITYSRGRSWKNTLLIIDEAQNLTVHEAKTILTRAGEGTKVVLLGDDEQIDNRALTRTSNGLIIAADRFRGEKLAGHVYFTKGERSELATLAARLLAR